MLYGNDNITPLLDWLYIGGVENNVRRTLPYIDIWINFAHESKREQKIREKIDKEVSYHPLRFDDGNLYQGQENWLKAYEIINQQRGKKILISCTEGVSRSAVMCLWILCEELGDFDTAYQHIKEKRNIFIDKGFMDFVHYLKEIYSIEKGEK
jgi:protein-tyrosine phosphatase